jgi:hypothetical protein
MGPCAWVRRVQRFWPIERNMISVRPDHSRLMLKRSGTVAELHRGPRYSFNDADLRRRQELAQDLEVA